MTSLRLEKRQNQPDLQKIMTTAIIEIQKEKLLTKDRVCYKSSEIESQKISKGILLWAKFTMAFTA